MIVKVFFYMLVLFVFSFCQQIDSVYSISVPNSAGNWFICGLVCGGLFAWGAFFHK